MIRKSYKKTLDTEVYEPSETDYRKTQRDEGDDESFPVIKTFSVQVSYSIRLKELEMGVTSVSS